MVSGMSWFRWHHGSVNDPKFQLVAVKAGASLAEVLAVWAVLLEAASAAEDRGSVGKQDFEALDCALGMEDGKAAAIFQQMIMRALVGEDGRITRWEKRQPKREREDNTASERKRRQRARGAESQGSNPAWETERNGTPCHATSHHAPPREEEIRAEVNTSDAYASGGEPPCPSAPADASTYKNPVQITHDETIFGYGLPLLTVAGTPEKQARSFLGGLRKRHGDPALVDALRGCIMAKPLQPLEWLAAALPPPGSKKGRRKMPALDDFASKDYGVGGKL